MNWYLVHTKPRQEQYALENLQWQGYECYFPVMPAEKLRLGKISTALQPLFPRYLFIRLGQGPSAQSWTPIRSTKGASRLVTFGNTPAKVDYALITLLRGQGSQFRLSQIAYLKRASGFVLRPVLLQTLKAFIK
jgi:transcriptional antiterminator RfaH